MPGPPADALTNSGFPPCPSNMSPDNYYICVDSNGNSHIVGSYDGEVYCNGSYCSQWDATTDTWIPCASGSCSGSPGIGPGGSGGGSTGGGNSPPTDQQKLMALAASGQMATNYMTCVGKGAARGALVGATLGQGVKWAGARFFPEMGLSTIITGPITLVVAWGAYATSGLYATATCNF